MRNWTQLHVPDGEGPGGNTVLGLKKKEGLFDAVTNRAAGSHIQLDTFTPRGPDGCIYGTMADSRGKKCFVEIPLAAIQITCFTEADGTANP